jgi:hypothetical protein
MPRSSRSWPARGAWCPALQHRHRLNQHQLGLVAPGLRRVVRAQRGLGRGDARGRRGPVPPPCDRLSRDALLQQERGIVKRPSLAKAPRPASSTSSTRGPATPRRRQGSSSPRTAGRSRAPWGATRPCGRRSWPPRQTAGARRHPRLDRPDPELLMSHHVVVSKAGGATTQEAIAARCPMIVNQVVPGQEEGNCELLLRHGAGALATTPEAVIRRSARRSRTTAPGGTHGARPWSPWRGPTRPGPSPPGARPCEQGVRRVKPRDLCGRAYETALHLQPEVRKAPPHAGRSCRCSKSFIAARALDADLVLHGGTRARDRDRPGRGGRGMPADCRRGRRRHRERGGPGAHPHARGHGARALRLRQRPRAPPGLPKDLPEGALELAAGTSGRVAELDTGPPTASRSSTRWGSASTPTSPGASTG